MKYTDKRITFFKTRFGGLLVCVVFVIAAMVGMYFLFSSLTPLLFASAHDSLLVPFLASFGILMVIVMSCVFFAGKNSKYTPYLAIKDTDFPVPYYPPEMELKNQHMIYPQDLKKDGIKLYPVWKNNTVWQDELAFEAYDGDYARFVSKKNSVTYLVGPKNMKYFVLARWIGIKQFRENSPSLKMTVIEVFSVLHSQLIS